MFYNQADPYAGSYDGGYYGGGYDGGGYDGGDSGGTGTTEPTDPTRPPPKLGPNGWWALVNGVWRWITEPVSRTVSPSV